MAFEPMILKEIKKKFHRIRTLEKCITKSAHEANAALLIAKVAHETLIGRAGGAR